MKSKKPSKCPSCDKQISYIRMMNKSWIPRLECPECHTKLIFDRTDMMRKSMYFLIPIFVTLNIDSFTDIHGRTLALIKLAILITGFILWQISLGSVQFRIKTV